MNMHYTFVSSNYYFAVKEYLGGLDIYDKETDEFLRSLDGYTMADFTYNDKVDDSKLYDAIEELNVDWKASVSPESALPIGRK